jgi:hypothetical protein
MPKEMDYENLRRCLDNYHAEKIFIREMGSCGGKTKLRESLEGKTLDMHHSDEGLSVLIDGEEVFHLPPHNGDKGFSLIYERTDEEGIKIYLPTGIDPDDPKLPEPDCSKLRNDYGTLLLEITYKGRIPLKFHSYQKYGGKKINLKYWRVDTEAIGKK